MESKDMVPFGRLPPIPMLLHCPGVVVRSGVPSICAVRHVDKGEFATKPHHTHSCQSCGHTWRPAVVDTVGVQFLPGFKDQDVQVREAQVDRASNGSKDAGVSRG